MPVALMRGAVIDGATGGATQDFTISGFGTPKAALFIVTARASSAGSTAPKNLAVGFTDGTNHRGIGALSRDAQANSDTRSQAYDNTVLRFLLADGSDNDAILTFNSWITDGIRLNLSRAFDAACRIQVILFGGADLSAAVGTATPNATSGADVAVSVGFEPDLLFCISDNGAFNETIDTGAMLNCFALAVNDQPGATVRSMTMRHTDNQANASPTMVFGDTDLAVFHSGENTPLTILAGTALAGSDPFTATGFNIKSLAHASGTTGPTLGYLAIKLGGVPFSLDTYATPTTTGNQAYTAPGFRVKSAFGFLSVITGTWGSLNEQSGSQAGAMGFCFLDESQDASLTLYDEDNAATMNTSSRWDDAPLHIREHTDTTSQYTATVQSRDENGITFNFSVAPASAMRFVLLTIGELNVLPTMEGGGAGSETISGSGAPAMPVLEGAASGTETISGSGAPAIPSSQAAGAGTETITGTGSPLLPSADGSGSGTETITGAGAAPLPSVEGAGAGSMSVAGSGAPVLPSTSGAGTGTETISGSGAPALPSMLGAPLPPFSIDLQVSAMRVLVLARPYTKAVTPIDLPEVFPAYLLPNRDARVVVSTAWQTDVTSSADDSTEERRGLLDRPVRTVRYSLLGMSRDDANKLFMFGNRRAIAHGQGPLVPHHVTITGEASGDTIPGDFSMRPIFVGARVLIHAWDSKTRRPSRVAHHTIEAIEDGSIIVSPDLADPYPKGSRVMPLIDCDISLEMDATALTDEHVDVTVEVNEIGGPSCLPALVPDLADIFPIAPDGNPILDMEPDREGGVEHGITRQGEDINLGRGHMTVGDGPRGAYRANLPFKLKRPQWWDLARFFDSRRGRLRPFWAMSLTQQLDVVEYGADYVDVMPSGSIEDAETFGVAVGFRTRSGLRVVRVVEEIIDNTGTTGTWRIELDNRIDEIIGQDMRRVGWAHLVRWDSDDITEDWETDDFCTTTLPIVELVNEKRVDIPDIEKDVEILEGIPSKDLDLYAWFESNVNVWEGNSKLAPATFRVSKANTDSAWHADFWDDARLNAALLYPDGEFPTPYLYRGLSSDDVGPFYVRFNKKKKIFKGKPVFEHSGAVGAKWKLANDGLHFWSGAGLTIMMVVSMKKGVNHTLVNRPGVLEWDSTQVRMWSTIGVDVPSEWLTLPAYQIVPTKTYVLRWVPGSDLRVIRGGKVIAHKTTGVVSALPTDPIDTELFSMLATFDGKAGYGNYKKQAFSIAFRIYRRAITAAEMNVIGNKWKKTWGAKWGNVSGF